MSEDVETYRGRAEHARLAAKAAFDKQQRRISKSWPRRMRPRRLRPRGCGEGHRPTRKIEIHGRPCCRRRCVAAGRFGVAPRPSDPGSTPTRARDKGRRMSGGSIRARFDAERTIAGRSGSRRPPIAVIVPPAPLLTNRLLVNEFTVPFTPVPLNETFELDSRSTAPPVVKMPVVLPLTVLLSTVASVLACSMSRPKVLPENTELLTIAFAPPLTVNAAVAELCTRTFGSVASILFVPPAAMRMPESAVCRIAVLETTSLPPLVRSSEMPRPVNPSILVFSMTTEDPARLMLRILHAVQPRCRPR